MKKRILIISFSELHSDPRILRQIHSLSDEFDIIAAGLTDPQVPNVQYVALLQNKKSLHKLTSLGLSLLGLHDVRYWDQENRKNLQNLMQLDFDLVLGNDVEALPLCTRLAEKKAVRFVYDAHEYSPLMADNDYKWVLYSKAFFTHICKKYLSRVDRMMTVCDGISRKYKSEFGVESIIVTNAPAFEDLSPSAVTDGHFRMIHHGGAHPDRNLESIVDVMVLLDERFSLDFMLVPSKSNPGYMDKLMNYASRCKRIKFIEAVKTKEISAKINAYDIGIYLLPPSNFNNKYSLPNKFFEFIQGRLCLAIGPSEEMKKVVDQFELGVVANSFDAKDLAGRINQLTSEQVTRYKANSNKHAMELSSNSNIIKIRELVQSAFHVNE